MKLMEDKFNQKKKKKTRARKRRKPKHGKINQAIKNKSMFIKVYHTSAISTAYATNSAQWSLQIEERAKLNENV